MSPVRVLIVDDSPLDRALVRDVFQRDPSIEILAEATHGAEALARVHELRPDVVVMDAVMPVMDGVTCTRRIMQETPRPILAMSEDSDHSDSRGFSMLEAGAVMLLRKPIERDLEDERACARLCRKVRQAAEIPVVTRRADARQRPRRASTHKSARLVCIGASTGGPRIVSELLTNALLPCPILIVQHMSPGFMHGFAAHLARNTHYSVEVAVDRAPLRDRTVYLAPDHHHMRVENGMLRAAVGPPVAGHCPSIDVLFRSLAEARLAPRTVGVLLTGMGKDGAAGLLALRQAGATTLVQDEPSSVVFGMAREAVRLGAVAEQCSPTALSERLGDLIRKGTEHEAD